ncbi:hypothetical protein F2Q69_00003389 [Brassica cretica]|uniref:Reverse transcriptase zinc-binding domain-containing protein n=1 Tax=Brassica cretica TaxID=69181 RepID=A0A8S9PIG7_BRACR|nr:hypothetical protein F2Q69_00003389 [Brassica cretica]
MQIEESNMDLNQVHEDVQNLAGMKVALPRIWQLVNKVEGKVNDDDTVNFYFAKEQHLQRGSSGGLAMMWNDRVKVKFFGNPTLNATDMYIEDGSAGFYQNRPRLMLGDFNDIKDNTEKEGGVRRGFYTHGMGIDLNITSEQEMIELWLLANGWRKNIGGRRAGYNGFKQETETPDSFTQKQSRGEAIIGSFISRMRKVNLIWSILQARSLLQEGIKWIVGDGSKIRVWEDNWIHTQPAKAASGPGKEAFPYLKARDLMIEGTKSWNEHLINSAISPEDAQYILNIRLSSAMNQDTPIWNFTKTGEYTKLKRSSAENFRRPKTLAVELSLSPVPSLSSLSSLPPPRRCRVVVMVVVAADWWWWSDLAALLFPCSNSVQISSPLSLVSRSGSRSRLRWSVLNPFFSHVLYTPLCSSYD